MEQVHDLNDVILTIYEEVELKNDGVADGSTTLTSSLAQFISKGVSKDDKLFIVDRGFFTVASDPILETQLVLDKAVPTGSSLKFSVGKNIAPRRRAVLDQNYSGSGDLVLRGASEFDGIVTGTYNAFIGSDTFQYTHRDNNTLKGVSGLGTHSKGVVVRQNRPKTELHFVQALRLGERSVKAMIPQFRTSYRKKVHLNTEITLDFSTLVTDLDLVKRLKNPEKEYAIRVFFKMPETFQEDGFNVIGCSILNANMNNQDNSNSTQELSYMGTYKDDFIKE